MLALEQKALLNIILIIMIFAFACGCSSILIWERYKDKEIVECKPTIKIEEKEVIKVKKEVITNNCDICNNKLKNCWNEFETNCDMECKECVCDVTEYTKKIDELREDRDNCKKGEAQMDMRLKDCEAKLPFN